MRKGCSAARIAGTPSPSAANCRRAQCAAASPGRRKPGGLSRAHWTPSGSPAGPLEPKQPLHLVPHGDAQVDAERKQRERNQPEANVCRAALSRTPLAVLSLRSLAPIFPTDGARVVDRYVWRRLPRGLGHPRKFSGPPGQRSGQWPDRQRPPAPWPAITLRQSPRSPLSRLPALPADDRGLRLGARDPGSGQRHRPGQWPDRQRRRLPGPRSRRARVHARPCQGCQPCLRTIAASGLVRVIQEAENVTGQAMRTPKRLRAAILWSGGR